MEHTCWADPFQILLGVILYTYEGSNLKAILHRTDNLFIMASCHGSILETMNRRHKSHAPDPNLGTMTAAVMMMMMNRRSMYSIYGKEH